MKYQKKIKTSHDYIINMEELTNEVNRCDKEFGIDLKNPRTYKDPDQMYLFMLDNGIRYLTRLLFIINGYDTKSFYPSSDMSNIDWSSKHYEITSTMFSLRFLSILIVSYQECLEQIIQNKVDQIDNIDKDIEKYYMMKEMIEDIGRLVKLMINNYEYKNSLLKIYFNFTNMKEIGVSKCNSRVFLSRQEILNFDIYSEEEDSLIYMITRLSAILTTGRGGVKNFIKFKDIEGCNFQCNMYELIKELGRYIIKKCDEDYHPLYRIFELSRPVIKMPENKKFKLGASALLFTAFMIQDFSIYKCIEKMISGCS